MNYGRIGLFFLLISAAFTDWKKGRIYNLQIAAGLGLGVFAALSGGFPEKESLLFIARVFVVCAALYPLFIWKMMGAGDIKLMAVCVGILGVSDGILMLFWGLSLAAASAVRRMWLEGRLWERLSGLAAFFLEGGGKKSRYQFIYQKEDVIHLGPYLFTGYGLFLIVYRG